MKVTIFKDLFKETDVPYIVTIDKIINRLVDGAAMDKVLKIRAEKDKDKRKKIKYKLPVIIFSGEFSERSKAGLIKHSGLMVTDLDKIPSEDEYFRMFNLLKSNPHVYLAFKSPSGDGIKAVVRIPSCNQYEHEKYFKSFQREFNYDYWDNANCDVSRVCFESYDPNPYINKDATVFESKLVDEGYSVSEYVSHTPLTDEDKIIERIMSWNWKCDFAEGSRNIYIFSIASAFCEFGISEATSIGYIQNNIVYGNFKESETITTVKNAYKGRQFGTRFFEDYNKKKQLEEDILKQKKDVVLKKYDIDESDYDQIKEKVEHNIFWTIENNKVKIDSLKYKFFLERSGFKKYFHKTSQKPTWVIIKSNKVIETSTEKIKDFLLSYLLLNNHKQVWNYCANYHNMFSEQYLLMLDTVELMMLSDSKDKSYLAFNNGILTITKDNIELIDYIDVDGYIWESRIIKRDYEPLKNYSNEYQKFIHNISSKNSEPIEATIGYLLCTYKNKINNKAIILNDEVISDNPEGGTGKGLFVQGLKHIRKVSILDGKSFDDKKSFPYQTVSTETQILVFDDVKKNWDFESKFSLVTEGITIERKNKDAIKLSVEESPKMLVSTNYAIKGEGNSHDRRRHEIEIAQYYGKELTPYDEFKRQLFDDWNTPDWKAFDNYMISCIQLYLKVGLIDQDAKNIKLRKFIAETSMEFYEWAQDDVNLPMNTRNDKGEIFERFISEYKDYNKWLKRKRFSIWIQKYASYKGYEYLDGISNGFRWFEIINNDTKVPF